MKEVATTKYLCTNCEKVTTFKRIIKEEIFPVKGKEIKVNAEYCKCDNCGDEVFAPGINPDPFDLAYREYRKRHGLLQPESIRSWRKAYKLTQHEMASLLGLGIATLNRYENGALQNESHERLLRLAMNPDNYLKLLENPRQIISESRKRALLEAFRKTDAVSRSIDDAILIATGSARVDELTGYSKFNLRKLYNAILFFARDGVAKTKLNKLLFYADFKHFKEYTVSITGVQYVHLPYGPVPDNYEMYYASLISRNSLQIIEETYPDGYVCELLKIHKAPDINVFDTSEIRILASVREDFQGYTARQMKERSHEEEGYKSTSDRQTISYKYASQLSY